jgi:hypothetical protein
MGVYHLSQHEISDPSLPVYWRNAGLLVALPSIDLAPATPKEYQSASKQARRKQASKTQVAQGSTTRNSTDTSKSANSRQPRPSKRMWTERALVGDLTVSNSMRLPYM